jgi:hypothetical protein
MTKEIGRFKAKADDERIFTIIEYQDFTDAGTIDDPHATNPGLKRLLTSDGERVNFQADGTFQIVSSGLILCRIP